MGAAVTITVRPDADPERLRRSEVSPADGVATFAGLPPGPTLVTVTIKDGPSGSATIQVGTREIVTLQVTHDSLPGSGLRISVALRSRVGEGIDFDERWIGDLPPANDLWSLIETTAPFVIVDRMDTGGIGLGRSGVMGGRGASWTSTSVTLGDITVLAPNLTGLIPLAPDMTTVGAVSVTSGLSRIEADTPGVIVALTPRRPGAGRHGEMHASFTEPGMADTKRLPTAPPIARISTWRDAGAQVSGPLGKRTGILVSVAGARSQFVERDIPRLWTSDSVSLFSHLVNRTSERDQVRVVAAGQRVTYPFENRRVFADRSAAERGVFIQSSATWDRMVGPSQTSASIVFQHASFTPKFSSAAGGTVDRLLDGVVPSPPSTQVSSEWEVKGAIAPRAMAWGPSRHEFRAGVSGRRAIMNSQVVALPTVAEQVAGIAARVWVPNAPATDARRTRVHGAAYVADRMTIGSSLSIEAGIRTDLSNGLARGAAERIRWRSVSPRGSFQWSRGAVAIFGGAGLYRDPLTLSRLGFGDPGEVVSDVFRWLDLDNDRRFDLGERGVLVARRGWGQPVASIDPDLRAPRTFERTAGLELRYRQLLTFRSAAIWRDQTSLLGSINTGVPASSYRVSYVLDQYGDWDGPDDDQLLPIYDRLPDSFGKDAYLLTNPEGEKATYEGLEFTWLLNTRRLVAQFGVTAYRSRSWPGRLGFGVLENDQGVIGERLQEPNAQPVVQGSYFFDRSYVGKLAASYRAPGEIRLAFSARYQDGQPFSRVVIAPDLAGGAEMVHAYRTGRTRFTYTLTLDVRVEKGFTVAGHRAAVHLDVFNATRHLNEVEEDVLTTPAFRRSTAVQPPLTARLGFRIAF